MTARELTAEGLTAKRSAELVKISNTFKCDIWVLSENKKINAKSIMGVISLGIRSPRKITVKADGDGESEAIAALISFFEASHG